MGKMTLQGEFTLQDFDDINVGAHFFASGGGGALENGTMLLAQARKALQKRGAQSVAYMSPSAIADDVWLAVSAAMGAPQKFLEYGYGKSPVSAFLAHQRLLQNRLGDPNFAFSTLVPVESGSIAHSMTLLVGATLGLPIVDGDGGGRAFPCLQMATYANPGTAANIHVSPCILASEQAINQGGATLAFECDSATVVDALSRAIISQGSGFEDRASLSSFAMTGAQIKQPNAVVPGSMTRARDLGRGLRECIAKKTDPVAFVEGFTGGHVLCRGEIRQVEAQTRGGFDWLNIHIVDADEQEFIVVAKNENMMVWSANRDTPLALAPDLICYLQPDGTVLSNSEIQSRFKPGQAMPVVLFVLDAPTEINNRWFHDQFAEVFRSYGYYGCYHPPIVE